MTRKSTKYQPLNLNPSIDRENSLPLQNAELFLRDAHAMLFLPRNDIAALQTGCNYAMLITLCSLLGGLSRTIYPRTIPKNDFDKPCFIKLISRMPWGNEEQGWIPLATAANLLYEGFRCPLIHELGTDEGGKAKKQPPPHDKYVVGKRGMVPENQSFIEILNRDKWNNKWAVMHYKDKEMTMIKISLIGLYFHTRKLIELLSYDESLIKEGILPIHPK